MGKKPSPASASDHFAAAMALPTYKYPPLEKTLKIDLDETMLIEPFQHAITNHTSRHPVIGTCGIGPCGVVLLYNRTTKTAGLSHEVGIEVSGTFQGLLPMVRNNDKDIIDLHVVGAGYDMNETTNKRYQLNEALLSSLQSFAVEAMNTPNVHLRTFDVYNKMKPHAVAIDARNGRLHAGTNLTKYGDSDVEHIDTDIFGEWNEQGDLSSFDGTAPENQL